MTIPGRCPDKIWDNQDGGSTLSTYPRWLNRRRRSAKGLAPFAPLPLRDIRLEQDYADAQNNPGYAFYAKGQIDEAIHQFQEARASPFRMSSFSLAAQDSIWAASTMAAPSAVRHH
jgi:hypothetical protein